ncbi:PH domain-containing protein [Bacillus sp. H-16]|uniref:PH domain-containing protein n=1 Tax=Alteribacter salitolerans TaxID=2912333 RepID=UPI0019649978|nr:PH domain-containing protein [Alteribacter salitolerans]MBM7094590.1 PH domain-containing protein [Alteribacter salitolerans]
MNEYEPRTVPDQKIAPGALTVWRIASLIELLLFALVPFAYWWLSATFAFLPFWIIFLIIGAWVLYGVFNVILLPKWQWKRWRYKIYENEIELLYGVLVIRRVIIPMIRVQHVDTEQGPLLRKYGLSSVKISTAATVHEIPALEESKADDVRDHIARLAREADPDE